MNTTNNKKNILDKIAGRRRSCLGCLGRGAIGLVILLVVVLVAGSIYQAAASASDLKKYLPPGELYDVGDYRLHLYCTGDASLAGAMARQPHRDPGSGIGTPCPDLVPGAKGSG